MYTLTIDVNEEYDVFIGQDLLNQTFIEFCQPLANQFAIIADQNIAPLYAEPLLSQFQDKQLKVEMIVIDARESFKTRATKGSIEDQLFAAGFGRDTCIIAIGGGVTTDLVGFVAATFCRGVPVIYVPTSLLAMVDASIGGKTGVNTSAGKNLIGSFKQPAAVFMDVNTLATLTKAEMLNGTMEAIKHGLLADEDFFTFIDKNLVQIIEGEASLLLALIKRSCFVKQQIIEMDCHEQGIRKILNLGHTIGHALERATDYQMPHGQAVAEGIVAECIMARKMQILPEDDYQKIKSFFEQDAVAFKKQNYSFDLNQLNDTIAQDKKSQKNIPHFVLLQSIGEPYLEKGYALPVPHDLLNQTLSDLVKKLSC